ncbi:glycosyl hydrolase-related protein [Desertivirga arenae]|uniref:glycosyl hydrolase-related protein n=1 Tax=Desertivirga arenae TaxID=2810309 RepID=UPI001A963EAF|nr:hypothetical protein [Pedobacter sp. SYSU D00823]
MTFDQGALFLRFYNAFESGAENKVLLTGHVKKAELVELDGRVKQYMTISRQGAESVVRFSIPAFGIRTIKVYY